MGIAAMSWAVLALSGTATGIVLPSSDAKDVELTQPSRWQCVSLAENKKSDEREIELRLENTCGETVSCSVAWTVTCNGRATAFRESAVLPTSTAKTMLASAASCDGDWRVSAPQWSCQSAK